MKSEESVDAPENGAFHSNGWRWLITIVVVSLLTACGGGGENDGNEPDPGNDPDRDVIVNEDVRVLDESARLFLDDFELDTTRNEGEIRFDASSTFAQNVEVGRILVTEPVDGVAPYGFLQRVETKRTEDGQIVFGTAQATLQETFDKAKVRYEQTLHPDDLVGTETRTQGIELRTRQQPLGFDFGIDFNQVLVDADGEESTTDDQLTLNGDIQFNASARADIDIGWVAELEHFMFRIDLGESVDLEITGTKTGTFDERIQVATYNFGTFTIFVGPVPVVFHVNMEVAVGADGSFEATMVATARQSTDVTIGASYKDFRGWQNLSEVDSSFNFPPPQITASGRARVFVEPRVNVRIYGIVGPFVLATAYLEANAELFRAPFWELYAGIDFGVGFSVRPSRGPARM